VKRISLFVLSVLFCQTVSAATLYHEARVKRVLLDGQSYGGCLIYFYPKLPSNLNCRQDYVSLDCNGELANTSAHGKAMFDLAQVAFLTDHQIKVRVAEV